MVSVPGPGLANRPVWGVYQARLANFQVHTMQSVPERWHLSWLPSWRLSTCPPASAWRPLHDGCVPLDVEASLEVAEHLELARPSMVGRVQFQLLWVPSQVLQPWQLKGLVNSRESPPIVHALWAEFAAPVQLRFPSIVASARQQQFHTTETAEGCTPDGRFNVQLQSSARAATLLPRGGPVA